MCGRFGLWATTAEVAEYFALAEVPRVSPRYNITPAQDIMAVGINATGQRRAAWLHWGLVPHWAGAGKGARGMINARAETVFTKPWFRDAARGARCLIPANCFFEWSESRSSGRQPWCIRPRQGGLFAFAGLWDLWVDPDSGRRLHSCAIITTASNEAVARVHDRMPVILSLRHHDLWLDRSVRDVGTLLPLLVAVPAAELKIYPVGTAVNDPAHDSAANIVRSEPVASGDGFG
ncbi:MAG: SOS response-associated peptidase [Deltaproteobacteria bacterium]|nr:SOS response-associated peptidase [Candidatus Anaeroferrophillacea bacterium]